MDSAQQVENEKIAEGICAPIVNLKYPIDAWSFPQYRPFIETRLGRIQNEGRTSPTPSIMDPFGFQFILSHSVRNQKKRSYFED
jgi:hypothetical protein